MKKEVLLPVDAMVLRCVQEGKEGEREGRDDDGEMGRRSKKNDAVIDSGPATAALLPASKQSITTAMPMVLSAFFLCVCRGPPREVKREGLAHRSGR